MELLEADFAQIEHINQILINSWYHESWACFDTHYVIKAYQDLLKLLYPSSTTTQTNNMIGTYDETNPKNSAMTKNVKDLRYDSFIVNITKLTDGWKYEFNIRNALWDGSYKITKSKNSKDDADETFDKSKVIITRDNSNGNNVVFTIKGDDSDRVRICFHMNYSGKERKIETSSISIDNPKEYTHQFDETVCEIGYIKTESGEPVVGAEVSIEPVDSHGLPITKGIPAKTVKTDSNGEFKMCYGAVDTPGDYYVLMKASYEGVETTQLIHIKKVQQQTIIINWGDEAQYQASSNYKGSIRTYEIPLEVTNEFGVHESKLDVKLKNLTFNVDFITYGGKTAISETCKVNEKNGVYYITPTISYRNYYHPWGRIKVSLPIDSGFGSVEDEHIVHLGWCIADDYKELKDNAIDVNGPDWIFLDAKEYTCTAPLTLTREMTIAGLEGDTPCTINGNNQAIIVIEAPSPDTDNYMEVNILGIKFRNAQGAIQQNTGSRLLVDSCYFTGNKHDSKHHTGCSIYMPITDETVENHKLWKTEIRNSRFHNNKGNEIQSIGKTLITRCMFTTDNKEYLQQPEVKVVSVRAGEVTYTYNKSHIKIPFTNKSDSMPMNHSYAKALAYVDTGATFNGKGPKSLQGNMTLPLYGSPWYNEAYTRCCYYYPYENVRTYIVCSPRKGYERKATGHSSSIENWVFYDGYYFTRLENSKGNYTDPWTEAELVLPGNTGIYDEIKNQFKSGYDPRFENNKSKTSEV